MRTIHDAGAFYVDAVDAAVGRLRGVADLPGIEFAATELLALTGAAISDMGIFEVQRVVGAGDVGELLYRPAMAAAEVTGTTVWIEGRTPALRQTCFGEASRGRVAACLLEACRRFMVVAAEQYDVENSLLRPEVRTRYRAAFLDGMSLGLAATLRGIRPAGDDERRSTALAVEELARRGVSIRPRNSPSVRWFADGFKDGVAMGRRGPVDAILFVDRAFGVWVDKRTTQ